MRLQSYCQSKNVFICSENRDFLRLLRTLDNTGTKKLEGISSIIIGGVLFLRLIVPTIISPEKYNLAPTRSVTPEGLQALIIIAKILQRLANETTSQDRVLKCTNRFVRKNLPKWRKFFHTLIVSSIICSQQTGSEPLDGNIFKTIDDITPEDLLSLSNQCMDSNTLRRVGSVLPKVTLWRQIFLSQQKEMIEKTLKLEKTVEGWKETLKGDRKISYHTFKVAFQ